jgi:phosphoglycolate phosphatase-like HAD superfamily hydrolase
MANRKRSKQLKIYLSDEEYQSFLEQVEKSNLSQTDFFIRCVTKKKIIVVDGLKETLTELKRIGVNLNQISKNLNGGIFQNADNELKAVKEEFSKVNDTMLTLLKGVK